MLKGENTLHFDTFLNTTTHNTHTHTTMEDPKYTDRSNFMNSKMNKRAKVLPDNLKFNGTTPSGLPRTFVCDVCTRAFSRQEHLTRHQRSHTNERPYECGICDRNFTRRDLLLRHALKVHNGNMGETIKKINRLNKSKAKSKAKSTSSSSSNPKTTRRRRTSSTSTASNNNNNNNNNVRRASMGTAPRKPPTNQSPPEQTNNNNNDNNINNNNSMFFVGLNQNVNININLSSLPSSKSSISPTSDIFSLTPTPKSSLNDWYPANEISLSRNSNRQLPTLFPPHSSSSTAASTIPKQNNKNLQLYHPLPKRRISFSAQSAENYALPLYHPTDLPSLDKVQFSTPTLMPLDLYNIFDFDNINNTFNYDNINNITFPEQISAASTSSSSSSDASASESSSQEIKADGVETNNTQNSVNYPIKLEQVLEDIPIQFNQDNIEPLSLNNNDNYVIKEEEEEEDVINRSSNNITHEFPPTFRNLKFDGLSTTQTPLTLSQDPGSVHHLDLNPTTSISPLNPNDLIGYLNTDSNPLHLTQSGFFNDISIIDNHFISSPIKPSIEVPSLFENIYNDYMTNERNNIQPKNNDNNNNATNDNNDYSFYGVDYLTLANISKASPKDNTPLSQIPKSIDPIHDNIGDDANNYNDNDNNNSNSNSATLFNSQLHKYCHVILRYYLDNHANTHNGYSDPNFIAKDLLLPSCHELNNFLTLFKNNFLIHYPFIHESLLNCDFLSLQRYLYEDISLTESQVQFHENDAILNMARSICLPLLMATIGSLFKKGCHPKTIILYEISRRALHVFLELEKSNSSNNNINNDGMNINIVHTQCTWLIQVFILNIIFALFADDQKSMKSEVVVRQVSAICSVLKKNYLNRVSIDSLPIDPFISQAQEITFPDSFQLLLFESRIRSTLMLYEYCQYLDICYNINSKSFLNEKDIDNLCIPEDEMVWRSASLTDVNSSTGINPTKKVHCVSFKEFYNSFGFNNSGFYAIPESMAKSMMFYEFKSRKTSPFHIFLTRIDTRKLEMNLSAVHMLDNDYDLTAVSLINDSTTLKDYLMVMIFIKEIDKNIGDNIWNSEMRILFDTFLDSRNFNMLTNCSYHLLTDFLVALNYSIQNISRLLLPDEQTSKDIFIDRKKLTIFNLQGFYYNFLIILKFVLDFESTPNFKLLCIFTDLNNMANKFLIPFFKPFYSSEFQIFDTRNNNNNNNNTKESSYSVKNFKNIENTINNVLVYAFNDASYLNMSTKNKTNEFLFHPTLDESNNINSNGNNDDKQICSASSINLLKFCNSNNHDNVNKQTFAERYQLSLKFIIIAKCFFSILTEHYSHCNIINKMIDDFGNLERILKQESSQLGISKLKLNT